MPFSGEIKLFEYVQKRSAYHGVPYLQTLRLVHESLEKFYEQNNVNLIEVETETGVVKDKYQGTYNGMDLYVVKKSVPFTIPEQGIVNISANMKIKFVSPTKKETLSLEKKIKTMILNVCKSLKPTIDNHAFGN